MAIANFEQLCASFCDVAGVPMPALSPDSDRTWSATIRMRGVEITMMQYACRQPGTAYLIADFGPMPDELAVSGWLALMDANLCHSGVDSPTYSRNPVTGHVLLQRPVRLSSISPAELHEVVNALVEMALQWRRDSFMPDPDAAYVRLLPSTAPDLRATDEWRRASVNFEVFCRDLATFMALENPSMPPAVPTEARALKGNYAGVRFTIAHAAFDQPDVAWVAVHFGPAISQPTPDVVLNMMDTNFALMASGRPTKFSRIRDTGELIVQFALPLHRANAKEFLGEVAMLAALVRELESSLEPANSDEGVIPWN